VACEHTCCSQATHRCMQSAQVHVGLAAKHQWPTFSARHSLKGKPDVAADQHAII
jgi:hypothetical protein